MAGIGVVINPHARGNRRKPRRRKLFEAIVGDVGTVVETGDLQELDAALAAFHAGNIEVLAVCGGDGSVFHLLSRAIDLWGEDALPPLLPLRGGTINNLSRSIGARIRRPEAMLAHVVEGLRGGRAPVLAHRDLIRVNRRDYGYVVGVGAVVRFLDLYYRARRPGPLSAFVLLVRLGLSWMFKTASIKEVMEPVEAEVCCDGSRLPFAGYSILIAASVAHLGLGVRPFYLSGTVPGRYHLLAGPSSAGRLLARLGHFALGLPARLDDLHDTAAGEVKAEFSRPQPITINGDILEPVTCLHLEAGPRVAFVSG